MLASIVIGTYNRANALPSTLGALADQQVPPTDYEVLVIDDGSRDGTTDVLASISVPFPLRTYRLPFNRGISAARNVGLRNAQGRYVILMSDDLLVPANFISLHVATLEAYPRAWVVGRFRQHPALTATPFGRFLDGLERSFDRARLGSPIDSDLYEMAVPTARNLSLRRSDLKLTGLFDERFRVTCEDQDLAERARAHGIRFIYNAALECVHNDQAADLKRYCVFQQRGAEDTVRLCDKYPGVHDDSPIARMNGYVTRADGGRLAARKLAKRLLSSRSGMRAIERGIARGERLGVPDRWLYRGYRLLIGLHIFRGWRDALRGAGGRPDSLSPG
jgi:glycosyltransferase involved in cell wall biosynthesis